MVMMPGVLSLLISMLNSRTESIDPFISIAKQLQQDSHRVRIAADVSYASRVRSHGLDFFAIPPITSSPRVGVPSRIKKVRLTLCIELQDSQWSDSQLSRSPSEPCPQPPPFPLRSIQTMLASLHCAIPGRRPALHGGRDHRHPNGACPHPLRGTSIDPAADHVRDTAEPYQSLPAS